MLTDICTLKLLKTGTPLRKRRYVFSECFAVIAMSEYAIAQEIKLMQKRL